MSNRPSLSSIQVSNSPVIVPCHHFEETFRKDVLCFLPEIQCLKFTVYAALMMNLQFDFKEPIKMIFIVQSVACNIGRL